MTVPGKSNGNVDLKKRKKEVPERERENRQREEKGAKRRRVWRKGDRK